MKSLVIGLMAILMLSACAGSSSASIQGQWKLVSYGSVPDQMPAVASVDTMIEFDSEGRMSGNVGCNNFGGGYTVDGDTITFSPVSTTEMFCETVADQESGTLAVLQEVTSFELDGNTMTITSVDGNSSIVLEKQ
ncbi:MAG TPA: META domain-containing protein [Anaerolineales bacterium]|nr:META domain-containing protein [Anaerolineales bacterium]